VLKVTRAAGTVEAAPDDLSGWVLPDDATWIDLLSPSREEERLVETALGLELPTREDMVEIEASSRLYMEDGAAVMTAVVLCNSEADVPTAEPVTFVLAPGRLVTIRYVKPKSFDVFDQQVDRQPEVCQTGMSVFLGLLDAVVDRTADILEKVGADVESISEQVFHGRGGPRLRAVMVRLGRTQLLSAKVRESLVSLGRLLSFAGLSHQFEADREARDHLKSLGGDVSSIMDHATYVSSNITFLLDAALGQIGIEQNEIMKIFSIAAVILMPPTLIAGVYGMNFEHIPELHWVTGYPLALVMMAISMLIPVWWFRRKGWL
jgi:magnesium transporter